MQKQVLINDYHLVPQKLDNFSQKSEEIGFDDQIDITSFMDDIDSDSDFDNEKYFYPLSNKTIN